LWRLDPLKFSAWRARYVSVTGGQEDVFGVVWNRFIFTEGKFRVVIYVFMANIASVVTENLDALQRWLTPCSVSLACQCGRLAFRFIALIAFNDKCCVVPVCIIVCIRSGRSVVKFVFICLTITWHNCVMAIAKMRNLAGDLSTHRWWWPFSCCLTCRGGLKLRKTFVTGKWHVFSCLKIFRSSIHRMSIRYTWRAANLCK